MKVRAIVACILQPSLLLLLLFHNAVTASLVSDQAAVTFLDADWPDDGTGGLPLGNGDLTASVWVSNNNSSSSSTCSTTITLTISKSDALDENGEFVKVGLLRISLLDSPIITDAKALRTTLNVTAATVDIVDNVNQRHVRIYVDYFSDVVRIQASGRKKPLRGVRVEIDLSLRPSVVTPVSSLMDEFCQPRYHRPDHILWDEESLDERTMVFYHQNVDGDNDSSSYFADTLQGQGLDPTQWQDPYRNLIFGGAVTTSPPLERVDETTLMSGNIDEEELLVEVTVLARQSRNVSEWSQVLADKTRKAQRRRSKAEQLHRQAWMALWNRSWIHVSSTTTGHNETNRNETAEANLLTNHLTWRRYMDLIQARQASVPIKFNGEAFTANMTGDGFDKRLWGSAYWWQNTRQPYYNAIAHGDDDVFLSLVKFYHKMLPLVKARTRVQYASGANDASKENAPVYDGAFYPEVTTAFGTYRACDWGCNSSTHHADGASLNTYIRYHYTGSLELCFLLLDHYEHRRDEGILQNYTIPIVEAVLSAFRERFPRRIGGRTKLFPINVLETYHCLDPRNRTSCPTNPSDVVAGLAAVLQRALRIPNGTISEHTLNQWRNQLKRLPSLPLTADGQQILPAASGCLDPKNIENNVLYLLHPFRTFSVGKPGLGLARNVYQQRPFQWCNNGWCYDIVAAAMIGKVKEVTRMLLERIRESSPFRFPGFAGKYQDAAPSLDHFSTLTTAVHRMLLQPMDDENGTVLLFPAWPHNKWNVDFQLMGPRNTTIHAACKHGRVTKLVVHPPERRKHVRIVGCGKGRKPQDTTNLPLDTSVQRNMLFPQPTKSMIGR